jgi:hypothetical protein
MSEREMYGMTGRNKKAEKNGISEVQNYRGNRHEHKCFLGRDAAVESGRYVRKFQRNLLSP